LNDAGVIVTLRAIEERVTGDMEKIIEEQTGDRRPDQVRDDITSASFWCDAKGGVPGCARKFRVVRVVLTNYDKTSPVI